MLGAGGPESYRVLHGLYIILMELLSHSLEITKFADVFNVLGCDFS